MGRFGSSICEARACEGVRRFNLPFEFRFSRAIPVCLGFYIDSTAKRRRLGIRRKRRFIYSFVRQLDRSRKPYKLPVYFIFLHILVVRELSELSFKFASNTASRLYILFYIERIVVVCSSFILYVFFLQVAEHLYRSPLFGRQSICRVIGHFIFDIFIVSFTVFTALQS